MREPESMDECVYFSRGKFSPTKGKYTAWAYRIECPKCKGLMKRPKKTAQEYVCPKCGYEEPKKDHEAKLEISVIYTCPFCGKDGSATTSYARKTLYGKPAFIFLCGSCNQKIGIYKKMNVPAKFLEKIGVADAVDVPDAE